MTAKTLPATRTLPHDLEAERSVLGAILLHNDAYATVRQQLAASDFFRVVHGQIYESIGHLLDPAHGSCDALTLRDALQKRGLLDEVGGISYLTALVDGIPRSSNVRAYATIVLEKSKLRQTIYLANALLSEAYEATRPAVEVLGQADREIVRLLHGVRASNMQTLQASSGALLDNLEYRLTHRGELTGITTGFPSIDDNTMGWQRGDLIILAARPSIGKTTFVMNTASAACESILPRTEQRPRGAIFSMEMKRQQLEYRLLSSLSGVELSVLHGGFMRDEQWSPLTDAVGRMSDMALAIDDLPGRTVWDIRNKCRELQSEAGLDFVVVDYIQLMPGTLERRGANRNEEITDISRRLKELASELNVAMLVLSQLSRASEGRSDPRPKLSDLRESGALEQDADVVAFLHRKNHKVGGLTNFIIEKARNGPTGTMNLTLHREITRFDDGSDEPPALLAELDPPPPSDAQAKQDAKVRAIIRHRAGKKR